MIRSEHRRRPENEKKLLNPDRSCPRTGGHASWFQQLRLPLAPSLLFPPFQLTDLRAAQICVLRCPSAMGRSSVLGRHKEVASESESSRLRGGFTRDVNVTLSGRNPVAIPIAIAHW